MNRFFVDTKNILEEQNYIFIDNVEDNKHISKVLRLTEGDCIEVCDGHNNEYITKIQTISKSKVDLTILEKKLSGTEPNIKVTLFQSIPKSDKMEMIIQKVTELGIFDVFPIISKRTIVKLNGKNKQKKIERWRKIAIEAAKQCKRGIIPDIKTPITFEQMLESVFQYDLVIIPYEKEKGQGFKNLLKSNGRFKKIAIVIGPEGGFDDQEILTAKKAGAVPVTLGPRILRTETAGFVALSILMYEIGDI